MFGIHANISVGHENDWDILQKRIISAAQCNADAVILSKSTPSLVIPDDKKYVSIPSTWGNLPYIEVAQRSEISQENMEKVANLCDQIGIPLIMSVTDSQAVDFVLNHTNCRTAKMHHLTENAYEMIRYCKQSFDHVYISARHIADIEHVYIAPRDNPRFTMYVTTNTFPPAVDELKFRRIPELKRKNFNVGYEGKEAGIFPAFAVAYMGVSWIEKYLGEDDSDNPSILTPQQFYDFFNTVHIMEQSY